MSEENVAVVREMLDRFAAGDRESWREVFAEDVIWDISATTMPQARVYEGHEGMERFFIDWLGTWKELTFETMDLIDAGDCVITVFHWTARGKASGVATEMTMFGVYDIEGGRIVRYRQYETRTEALEAAGLSEDEAQSSSSRSPDPAS
jgi:ketosteroid isomerase-like protein